MRHVQAVACTLVLCSCGTASSLHDESAPPEPPVQRLAAVQLAIAEGHVCARMEDATVWCWGEDLEIADAWMQRRNPVRVGAITDAVDVQMGLSHACARRADGSVMCWGWLGFLVQRDRPSYLAAPTPELEGIERLWIGMHGDGCARWPDGNTRCWGTLAGALATGSPGPTWPAPVVPALRDAVDFSLGETSGCAVMKDATARCWGYNHLGQLGDGSRTSSLEPMPVRNLEGVVQVAVRNDGACARLQNGTVSCWGANHLGQLGDGTTTERSIALPVLGIVDVVDLAAGGVHTFARHADGTLTCWGGNWIGECGNGKHHVQIAAPGRVVGLDRVVQVVAAHSHSCALRDDGTVWCWGHGWRGVIGDGLEEDRLRPTQVRWPS